MEFDELQARWAEQKQDDMYAINQEALRRNAAAKREGADRFTERTERFLLLVYLIGGFGLLVIATVLHEDDWASYVVGVLNLCVAGYIIWVRMERLRASGTFGRSIAGELDQAISDTTHRVMISRLTLSYLPLMAGLFIIQFAINGKPPWVILALFLFFGFSFLAGRREHRSLHQGKLTELKRMRRELDEAG